MNIYEKLLEVQKEIKPIVKDSTNPHFKNKYFDINTLLHEVKPILSKQGLVLTQGLDNLDGKICLVTCITMACITTPSDGQTNITYKCPLPECTDAQKYGSAITYFRRYALQSLLALEAEEDDDGNLARKDVQFTNEKRQFRI